MICMEKKRQYRFSIGLNSKLPKHAAVADILNDIGRGGISQLIVDAVWAYYHLEGAQPNTSQSKIEVQDEELNEKDIQNLISSLEMFSK